MRCRRDHVHVAIRSAVLCIYFGRILHNVMSTNTKRNKLAKLRVGTIQSSSAAVSKPDVNIVHVATVVEDLKKMRHISVFPQRQQLCEILESNSELLADLVASLVKDYADV